MVSGQGKGRVLLVDDEAAILESLGDLLAAFGFEVFTADGVKSAMQLINERDQIEAIISDLKMTGETGLDLIAELKKEDKKIPVIILTGYGTAATRQTAIQMGALDQINKPIDDNDKILIPLRQAIEQYWLPLQEFNKKLN